jgi:hypothetical protein
MVDDQEEVQLRAESPTRKRPPNSFAVAEIRKGLKKMLNSD